MCFSLHLLNVIKYLLFFFFKPVLGAFQKESHLNFSLSLADEEIRYERERNLMNVTQPVSGRVEFFLNKKLYSNTIVC